MNTEFHLTINGLELPQEAKDRISGELQKSLKREIAKLDLKGDLRVPKGTGGFSGGTAGMVADWQSF